MYIPDTFRGYIQKSDFKEIVNHRNHIFHTFLVENAPKIKNLQLLFTGTFLKYSTDPCAFRSRVFRLPAKCCYEHTELVLFRVWPMVHTSLILVVVNYEGRYWPSPTHMLLSELLS